MDISKRCIDLANNLPSVPVQRVKAYDFDVNLGENVGVEDLFNWFYFVVSD